jgi:hypothetical protein
MTTLEQLDKNVYDSAVVLLVPAFNCMVGLSVVGKILKFKSGLGLAGASIGFLTGLPEFWKIWKPEIEEDRKPDKLLEMLLMLAYLDSK